MDEGSVLVIESQLLVQTLFFVFDFIISQNCDSAVLPKGPDRMFLFDLERRYERKKGRVLCQRSDRSVRDNADQDAFFSPADCALVPFFISARTS